MSEPITPAAGCIATVKELLRTSLAACYYFQRWQGHSWSATEAEKRIYFDALPPPPNNQETYTKAQLHELRPFAIVYKSGPVRFRSIAAPGAYSIEGMLTVEFEQAVPSNLAKDPDELDRQFENFVGQIMATFDATKPGLRELSRLTSATYLWIESMEDDGPYRVQQEKVESLGDHQIYYLDVGWGVTL